MIDTLSRDELDIVELLCSKDPELSMSSAALAVVMATREHARPEAEMRDVLKQYPHLGSQNEVDNAIAVLKARKWLVVEPSYGIHLLQQSTDLREKIQNAIADPTIANRLSKLRASLEPLVRVLGPMADASVYNSYLSLLKAAQSDICLPMLATSPSLASVPTLREKALAGVRVRILLATPKIVAKIRGGEMKKNAEEAIAGWRRHAEGLAYMEVRIVDDIRYPEIATCMMIDGRTLRFDIYDPARQRSLEGIMIQVESLDGMRPNLLSLFEERFEKAWRQARPFGIRAIWWWLKKLDQLLFFLIFLLLAYYFSKSNLWQSVLSSAAATFLVNIVLLLVGWVRASLQGGS